MNDTAPALAHEFRQRLLSLTGGERLQLASSMFDSARAMMIASFPANLDPQQFKDLLLDRTYPELRNAERGKRKAENKTRKAESGNEGRKADRGVSAPNQDLRRIDR